MQTYKSYEYNYDVPSSHHGCSSSSSWEGGGFSGAGSLQQKA